MRKYHGLLALLLGSCIRFNSNQAASATRIPTASPEIFSAGSVNISNLHNSVTNVTLPGDIDPAFGLIPVFGGIKLRAVPCLLSAVNFLLQLGLEDFEGLIPETAFRLDSHPQVEIVVIPDDESVDIPRKYAIWGLSVGIAFMMKNNDFQTAVLVLTYDGGAAGCITFEVPGTSDSTPTELSDAMHSLNQTHLLANATEGHRQASTDANISTVDAANDPHLRVTFQLGGSVIKIFDIFFVAIDTLRELSVYDRTRDFDDFTSYIGEANMVITTRQTNPPRTARDPPYFQVEWLMRALAQTPAYMLEQRSFKEVDMVLFVDGTKIGEVSLRRQMNGIDLTQESDSVLIS